MQRWMEANFGSVAAMYEDRHQLWGFNHKGRLLQRSLPARRSQVRPPFPNFIGSLHKARGHLLDMGLYMDIFRFGG